MEQTTKSENTKLRIILTILLGCVSAALFYFLLGKIQDTSTVRQIQSEMKENITDLKERYQDAVNSFNCMEDANHELYQEDLSLLCSLPYMDPEFRISDEYLQTLYLAGGFYDIRILDRKGNVLASILDKEETSIDGMEDVLDQAFESKVMVVAPVLDTEEDVVVEEPGEDTEETEIPALVEDPFFWCIEAFDEEHAFAVLMCDAIKETLLAFTNPWMMLMEDNVIGDSGFDFAWDARTTRLLYYPDEAVRFQPVREIGLNPDQMKDSSFGWMEIQGQRLYVYGTYVPDDNAWIACAVSEEELKGANTLIRNVLSILFALFCAVLVYYAVLLLRQKKVKVLTDFTHSGAPVSHRSRKQKLLILTCAIVVILFLFHVYLRTLSLMSGWAESASVQTAKIEEGINEQEVFTKGFISYYEDHKQKQLAILEGLLSRMPDNTADSSQLDDLSFAIRAYKIQLLDSRGNIQSETTPLSYPSMLDEEVTEDTVSPADAVAIQDKNKPPTEWMSDGRKVLVPIHDEDGAVIGYLYVQYYSLMMDTALKQFSLENKLALIRPGKDGFVFSVDADTNKFEYFPGDKLTGRDALEYGLQERQIKDNYCDYIEVNGTSYYAVSDMIGTHLIYYAIARKDLLKSRLPISILAAACAGALLLLAGICLYLSKEQIELVQPAEGRHMAEDEKSSPEYKVLRVIISYLIIGAVVFTGFSSFLASQNSDGILGSVLGGRWEPGFNVFALTSSVIILCRGGLILFFASKFIHILGDVLPTRGGTILKMTGSLVTYVSVGFLLYQCAICFGLNPTALMASAGIVSVVVGIGANSLVGDILAGIFLLMEGNVQVGDVVQVGGFRGYVMDLGIRMTKLFDMDSDDVKIIPNNEVRNVVHMTMRSSIVYSEFQIRYEEHLESVEKILREELKKVPHKSSLILSGPVYIGVEALDENGVILKTATRCHESSRRKVEREVNHIVYSIFQKHQISVPYPQVTMHMGDDEMVEREES